MQPFDRDEFDKRFDEIYKPAIEEAGFEPYRVDKDPAASIPIVNIENGIRESAACFVDITKDNPNVWFEFGYAICANKPMCIVCERERERFPFDVQHRKIIRYKKGSPSDFDELHKDIVERLKSINERDVKIETLMKERANTDGDITELEFAALCVVFENIDSEEDGVFVSNAVNEMERLGFNKLGTKAAMTSLIHRGMVVKETEIDYNHNTSNVYRLTNSGEAYIMSNLNRLNVKADKKSNPFGRARGLLGDDSPY